MIGIDIIKVDRINKKLENQTFLNKVFSVKEIEYAASRQNPVQTFAGLFAAKEAVLKALGTGICSTDLNQVQILHTDLGQPYCKLDGKKTFKNINISISHDDGFAVAVAVLI